MKRLYGIILVLICMVITSGCLFEKTGQTTPVKEVETQQSKVPTEVPKGIPVLMYHKIGNDVNNDAVIREDLFKEQMKFLKDNGYHTISMEQLYDFVMHGTPVPVKPVVLNFDDGYADTYSIVYPVLKELGLQATIFVNPGDVGTRLTWDQLREMKSGGMTISNHGFQHISMGDLSKKEQIANIEKGQTKLASELGIIDNHWFCFPYGDMNEDSHEAVKTAGIAMAVTMNSGWVHTGDDPYTLNRVWIGNAVDIKHFEERLSTEHYSNL
ncbi:polysaccharide deacetylase family protein [Veillonella montpellierensis]|uniref:polysaccharide deacetylase family protein n=1 Tax=Veillonella montpellierensis TaxID=187328 RepID=UPI0023F74EA0|nr:polysaccharide deacetylase family protein [Veillonella montpellierensis]